MTATTVDDVSTQVVTGGVPTYTLLGGSTLQVVYTTQQSNRNKTIWFQEVRNR